MRGGDPLNCPLLALGAQIRPWAKSNECMMPGIVLVVTLQHLENPHGRRHVSYYNPWSHALPVHIENTRAFLEEERDRLTPVRGRKEAKRFQTKMGDAAAKSITRSPTLTHRFFTLPHPTHPRTNRILWRISKKTFGGISRKFLFVLELLFSGNIRCCGGYALWTGRTAAHIGGPLALPPGKKGYQKG